MANKIARSASARTRELVRPVSVTWWLERRTYFLYMVRELTCVAVGAYAVLLLALAASAHDPEAFHALFTWIRESPVSIALHLLALPLVVYHSITWFNLTPKVMVVWVGEEKLSPLLIAGSNYAAWIAVSALIAWLVLG